MAYERVSTELKEQILHRIRTEGISATQAAQEHGVGVKSVYYWLRKSTAMPSNILQMNKLRRENEDLKKLLAEAVLMNERSKKNRSL